MYIDFDILFESYSQNTNTIKKKNSYFHVL